LLSGKGPLCDYRPVPAPPSSMLVAEPEGWLAPWLIRTCAGLLAAVEAFVLCGRLCRRRN